MREMHGEQELVDEKLFTHTVMQRCAESFLRINRIVKKLLKEGTFKRENGKLIMKAYSPYLCVFPICDDPSIPQSETETVIRNMKSEMDLHNAAPLPGISSDSIPALKCLIV
jgi:hypothetical protein